jgi:hypothetical protein
MSTSNYSAASRFSVHIFRRTFGALDLVGRSKSFVSLVRYFENIGAAVPPEGPLILLLSVMLDLEGYKFVSGPSLG